MGVPPFMDIRSLTPPAGRMKCVWVPDWELDERLTREAAEPAHRAG